MLLSTYTSATQGKRSRALAGDLVLMVSTSKQPEKLDVYCADNIDTSCSAEDLRVFVSNLQVEVYSSRGDGETSRMSLCSLKSFTYALLMMIVTSC